MKVFRILCYCLLLTAAPLHAQTLLKLPLRFVSGENVLLVDPTTDNLVMKVMKVDPFLSPQTPTLFDQKGKLLKKEWKKVERSLKQQGSTHTSDQLPMLFLATADARLAALLDSTKHRLWESFNADSSNHDLAQSLLNTLCWTAATDERGVFLNFFDDCIVNVNTPTFRFTIDQIRTDNRLKYRISGLQSEQVQLAVRLRIPQGASPEGYFLNGKPLLATKVEKGYLVIERKWRNNEEVFIDL